MVTLLYVLAILTVLVVHRRGRALVVLLVLAIVAGPLARSADRKALRRAEAARRALRREWEGR